MGYTGVHALLDLGNRLARVEPLGANLGAVHDCVAAVELVRIVQLCNTLLGEVVTAINDPPAPKSISYISRLRYRGPPLY